MGQENSDVEDRKILSPWGGGSLLRYSVRQEQGRDRLREESRVEHEIVRVK